MKNWKRILSNVAIVLGIGLFVGALGEYEPGRRGATGIPSGPLAIGAMLVTGGVLGRRGS